MATLLMFPPKVHFDDDNGEPLVGGKVFTYEPGTSTPKDTYADKAQVATNTNPVILDARGEAEIWLNGEYKIVVKDTNDVEIYTVDNASTEGADTAVNEWLVTGDTPTYISATQFSVPADLTATYHVGRRVKLTVTAGIVYGVIKTTAYTTVTTVTVVLDSGAVDSGLSVSDVGLLSATNESYPINQIQYGGYAYVADTGAADVYVAVMVPPVPSYSTGFACRVLMANANATTTPTININGLGAKIIKLPTGSALRVGDIPANFIAELTYDGTDFILINQAQVPDHAHAGPGSGGALINVFYGDGADGVYASGATGNLAGDVQYPTTYSIGAGHVMTINTGKGIIVVATTSITIAGTLNANDIGATGSSTGVGSTGIGATGAGGGNNGGSINGSAGGASTYSELITVGGVGGVGGGGVGGGGNASSITNIVSAYFQGRYGSGGGAGGSVGSPTGAGGNGGGFIVLVAPTVTIEATATLDVSGANGGVGGASTDGGGGGGGAGEILIVTENYVDNGGTFVISGGSGGAGFSGGGAGGVGGTGLKRVMEL